MAKGKKKKVIKKPVKTRFNEIGTGRIIWVPENELKAFKRKYKQDLAKFQKQKVKQDLVIERKNFKAESFESLKENRALNFLGKEKKAKVLKIAKELDANFIEYSLKDILKQDLTKDKIVIIDKTPSQYFYWDIYNKVERKELGQNIDYIIKDFRGVLVYKGFDEGYVVSILDIYTKIIQKNEKIYMNLHNVNPYTSVGVFEGEFKNEKGELMTDSIEIHYNLIKTKLPADHEKEYLKLYDL